MYSNKDSPPNSAIPYELMGSFTLKLPQSSRAFFSVDLQTSKQHNQSRVRVREEMMVVRC